MAPEPDFRLSVILTTRNCRALAERAVDSVLSQADPVGTELIVADDASRDGTADHLESIFSSAISSQRLRVVRLGPSGDRGHLRNEAAAIARGSLLAFLGPEDRWRPLRLAQLESRLRRHDLIVSSTEPLGETTDWVRAFLSTNWAVPGSAVFRRSLFDELGGFPCGYGGHGLPRKVPGDPDYELLLRALIRLSETGRRHRALIVPNDDVDSDPMLPPELTRLHRKAAGLREAITLAYVLRDLPRKYWPALGRRVVGAGRGLLKRKRSGG